MKILAFVMMAVMFAIVCNGTVQEIVSDRGRNLSYKQACVAVVVGSLFVGVLITLVFFAMSHLVFYQSAAELHPSMSATMSSISTSGDAISASTSGTSVGNFTELDKSQEYGLGVVLAGTFGMIVFGIFNSSGK